MNNTLLALSAMWLIGTPFVAAAVTIDPTLTITLEHPILLSNADSGKPVATGISVIPVGFPVGAKLTYSWKQVQDVLSPLAAPMDNEHQITFSPAGSSSTAAAITGSGVFEIRLTVTDAENRIAVSRNTWVHVWDSRSPIMVNGKPDPLCVAPGSRPPPSVRNLSPDPGPFRHPRLLCTNSDWPEISTRSRHGKLAAIGLASLQKSHKETLGNPESPFGKLAATLEAYADTGFKGAAPALTMGIEAKQTEKGLNWGEAVGKLRQFSGELRNAAFLAWLDQDPNTQFAKVPQPQRDQSRKIAKITAALCQAILSQTWDQSTGKFNEASPFFSEVIDLPGGRMPDMGDVGLAYDFSATWMTPIEQQASRNFLFAQAAGRTTGARTPGFASGVHGRLQRGYEQNGDFMNIEEGKIYNALAVEGEEMGVSESVLKMFTTIPKPEKFETSPDITGYDLMMPADADGGGASKISQPLAEAASWPHARKASIENLQRAIWWNDDWYVSPWGFELNREAYYGFSAWGLWPTAVAYARRGAENQFVTGLLYQTVLHLLYSIYPKQIGGKSDNYASNIHLFDHHDGGWDYRQNHLVMMKYMYPDDSAVDYIYAAQAPFMGYNPFILTLFGLDPGINGKVTTLPALAQEKDLPVTKVDPQQGLVVARSGWNEDDMMLYFDEGWPDTGHMHAEKGNFGFHALGRAWSFSPGYHAVESTYQSEVLIQDPQFAKDAKTQGYMGEGPNLQPEASTYPNCFPTPPGRLFQVEESPDKLYTLMAGDHSFAYNFCCGGNGVDTGKSRREFMYPGLYEEIVKRIPDGGKMFNEKIKLTPNYNPVQYAFRSILFVRGARPYVLIVDDINKDNTPRNYRWQMNCSSMFGPPGLFMGENDKPVASDLEAEPGATSTGAILLHSPIDKGTGNGLPRLLLRDLSELGATPGAPPVEVNSFRMRDDDPNSSVHRAFLYRNQVPDPKFKVLLFPHRSGEPLPETTWNKQHTQLAIDLKNGRVDVISFDNSNPDHRTRIKMTRTP